MSPLPIPCTEQPHAHNICFRLCITIVLLKGLKVSFQGYFLTPSLLQFQGWWVFQTMNCAESTENTFPSTQVERAEQSSTNEAHVALRKQITMREVFTGGKRRKCSLQRLFPNWNIPNSGQVRFPDWKVLDSREGEDTGHLQLCMLLIKLLLSSCLLQNC